MKRSRALVGVLAVLLATVASASVAAARAVYEPQITNSADASPGEYPYMVSLQSHGFHFCGGSVIAPEWVLTAAHCVDGDDIDVYIGAVDLDGDGERIAVDGRIVHPDYVDATRGDDVALLHLSEPTEAPPVRLVAADELDLEAAGTPVTLTGWGYADADRTVAPTILREASMPVIDDAECAQVLAAWDGASGDDYDPVSMLCAGSPNTADGDLGTDACQGDSGGPLVATDSGERVQVGIVSWGPTCGQTPSAYARVSTYLGFIEAAMAGGAGDPEPDQVPDVVLGNTSRVAGANRYATAAALAADRFEPGVDIAFVVTGGAFADALAAAPAAANRGAPVLLTNRDAVPQETRTALESLTPSEIVVVGGTGAVSDAVFAELDALAIGGARRIAGRDRYETAAALVADGFAGLDDAFVVLASGESFADALGGAAYAASPAPSPLLLTAPGALPDATAAALREIGASFVLVLGGTAAVSGAVLAELDAMGISAERVAGANRYETSALLLGRFGGADEVVAATGASFPDGLVAGALGLPLALLPPGAGVPDATAEAIQALGASSMLVLGGTGAVSEGQALSLDELVGGRGRTPRPATGRVVRALSPRSAPAPG